MHQHLVRAENLGTVCVASPDAVATRRRPRPETTPAADREAHVEELPKPLLGARGEYGRDHLNALRKVPVHPVCRTDKEFAVDRILLAIGKMKDARVFQETPDNRSNADSFGSARQRPAAGSRSRE